MTAQTALLTYHPTTPCITVDRVQVTVQRMGPTLLRCDYMVLGNIKALRFSKHPLKPIDELWHHSCGELFVGTPDSDAYYEFNFAPSSVYMAYAFQSYRQGQRTHSLPTAPQITLHTAPPMLQLSAMVNLSGLPGLQAGAALRLGVSMVIEEKRRSVLSYWALNHPSATPDFHHAANFALQLPAIEPAETVA